MTALLLSLVLLPGPPLLAADQPAENYVEKADIDLVVNTSPPSVRPLLPCPAGAQPADLDAAEARCANGDMLADANKQVLDAKTEAANAYIDSLYGIGKKDRLADTEDWLLTVTGEAAVAEKSGRDILASQGKRVALKADPTQLRNNFWPFEQINSWYCGPATVQSILNFLGTKTSATRNGMTHQTDTLNGDPNHDQPVLASDYWLATNKNGGTNWGEAYVPFTLNAWRGSRWYVLDGTPNVGGTLTKDQALRNIRYDTDRGYPIAENVLYAPETYYPAGFWPGVRYQHWDTIYGMFTDGAGTRVQVGQVYHDKSLPYGQFQNIDWDVHWSAIDAWFGIVW